MRNRLRSFDSKVTFFAFADIMIAVSGILIFITLLLATDLGHLSAGQETSASTELQRKLEEVLRQQVQADNHNRRLEQSIAAAETAPSLEKLQADVAALRSRIVEQQRKQKGILDQVASLSSEIEKRDIVLGLTGLIVSIEKTVHDTDVLNAQESKLRDQAKSASSHLTSLESTLLQLRQREGQIWLIPDKSRTTKEPILVTVGGSRVTVERFDHPEQQVQFDDNNADSAFAAYLQKSHRQDQYVVFLVRPSGIEVFKQLLSDARSADFEVGYDAIDETRQIHFTTPPPLTNEPPTSTLPKTGQGTSPPATASSPPGASSSPAAAKSSPPAGSTVRTNASPARPVQTVQKEKSWWQRFLEWIGLSR
jgi:hypothetical protein